MGDVDRSTSYGKKRARIGGTKINKRPEIKKINMGFAADGTALTSVCIGSSPVLQELNRVQWPCWVPMSLQLPVQGTGPAERIGNKINLKWIKFKGYIRSFTNLPIPVRWRLVLYRTPFQINVEGYSNKITISNFAEMWENYEDAWTNGISVLTRWDRANHNFYKLVRKSDMWRELGIYRTVLAKGVVAPHQSRSMINFTKTYQAGSSTGVNDGTTYNGTGSSFEKRNGCDYVNARVVLNDTINCVQRSQFYYIVVETDGLFAMTYNTNVTTTLDSFNLLWADRTFELNFFIRGYFTDP